MKLKSWVGVVVGVIVLGSGVFLLTGGQTLQQWDAKKMEPRMLVEGGTAYIRVKEWAPKEGEAKLAFGEAVTLVKKKETDSPNNVQWLTLRNAGAQVWIPDYLLTSSEVEIASLKDKGRIPATMSFFYERQGSETFIAGANHILPFISISEGFPASNQGSDQVAIKGNGVVFDPTAVSHKWGMPMVFSNGSKTWELSSNLMCYCISVDETKGGGYAMSSNGIITAVPGGVDVQPKGTFDCVEIAGQPGANAK